MLIYKLTTVFGGQPRGNLLVPHGQMVNVTLKSPYGKRAPAAIGSAIGLISWSPLSWSFGALSSRPPAPGAQLVGPSEQFATVGGVPPKGNKEQFGPKLTLVGTDGPSNSVPNEREESSLACCSGYMALRRTSCLLPEQKKEKRHLGSIKTRPGDKNMTSFWFPLISFSSW